MDEIAARVTAGQPLDTVPVIDCHAHLGYWQNFNVPAGTAKDMVTSMDELGISMTCITAHAAIGPDFTLGNGMVGQAMADFPGRFAGYVTVNPNYPDEMVPELEKCFRVKGFMGIKLHPNMHGVSVDHPHYRRAYETAQLRKCPLLVHTWGVADIRCVDELAGQYPDASFIMGHSGGDMTGMEAAIGVMNRHENVHGDFALSTTLEGNVEWFVKEVRSKKMLFGSDVPFFDPRPAVGRIALSDLETSQKRDILGGNMKRLMGRAVL
jgi:hypothetical protein